MHVIARRQLIEFSEMHPDARAGLDAWYREARAARWQSPSDIAARYRSASFLMDNRVVFNIGGTRYRLVVRVNYASGTVFVRFVGTHGEYDRAEVETI